MKISLFPFDCPTCATSFQAAVLSDFSYGLLLYRTRGGEVQYVDAFGDPVFADISTRVNRALMGHSLEPNQLADAVQRVFGVCCDRSEGGRTFSSATLPRCAECEAVGHQSSDDPVGVLDVNHVTHVAWQAVEEREKQRWVDGELSGTVSSV